MTDEEKKVIRKSLPEVMIRTGEVKCILQQVIGDFELPHSALFLENNISDYKFELDGLNQAWHSTFKLWNLMEEAMTHATITLEQMKEAMESGLPGALSDLKRIEKSIM